MKLKGKVSVGSFTAVLVDVSHPSQEGQQAIGKGNDSGKTDPQVNPVRSH